MKFAVIPVILCGGSGTRLWPLSRQTHPKQFIKFGDETLFTKTVNRILGLGFEESIILCNQEQRFLAASELQDKKLNLQKHSLLLEPVARNTAPAIALAALKAIEINSEAQILILPSDHLLEPLEVFEKALEKGIKYAEKENIVTFGINPTEPSTGYGYIEKAEELEKELVYTIKKFTEKPEKEKALALLQSKAVWNSGMFLLKASVYLNELKHKREDIYKAVEKIWDTRKKDMDFTRFSPELFEACPAESIDYAIMEHTTKGILIPLSLQWSDLGSWDALYNAASHDSNGNALIGDCIAYDTKNSYIHSSHKLLATLGVNNLAIVETKDALLISDIHRTQEVKHLIEIMKKNNRKEQYEHCTVHRPWGSYESITQSERFQVKRIIVKPKGVLSMQLHNHRSEHWIVVKGTALVHCNGNEQLLKEDESTYIPLGVKHRLVNPGCIPLELIEIQTGSYLGEDDIERFEDLYGRVEK